MSRNALAVCRAVLYSCERERDGRTDGRGRRGAVLDRPLRSVETFSLERKEVIHGLRFDLRSRPSWSLSLQISCRLHNLKYGFCKWRRNLQLRSASLFVHAIRTTYVLDEVPPGPISLPSLDAPLRNDVLLVQLVARRQVRRPHQRNAAPAHLGRHPADQTGLRGEERRRRRSLVLIMRIAQRCFFRLQIDTDHCKELPPPPRVKRAPHPWVAPGWEGPRGGSGRSKSVSSPLITLSD